MKSENIDPESSESHEFVVVANGKEKGIYVQTTEIFEMKEKNGRADFEEAITACGYGKFNYLFILALIPACCAQVYSSVTMSYVIPIAECDLNLTNQDKGALNAAIYVGSTIGAVFGGFASDVFGRKKLIVLGLASEFLFNTMASFAHNFWFLFLMKVFSGFSIAGCAGAIISYSAETHNIQKRQQVIMISGGLFAIAQAAQSALAYYIIPMNFRIELIPGVLDYTSWRLFLFLCALPSFIAVLSFAFFPESPKFLMSQGRIDKAMESFQRIYAINTGEPGHTFPIYRLDVPAKPTKSSSSGGAVTVITNGWRQIRPMFLPPYLKTALVVFGISACTTFAMNTVRLWVPQLFATLNEAEQLNSTEVTSICDLIGSVVKAATSASKISETEHICLPIGGDVYLRTFVISATAAFSFLITTPITGWIGKKNFAKLCLPAAAATAISINYTTDKDTFMALLAVYTTLIRNTFSAMSTITVDLFPTAFRSMAMSTTMLCGRVASIVGNLIFPVLLNLGCSVVFLSLGGVLIVGSALVWFVSNKTEKL